MLENLTEINALWIQRFGEILFSRGFLWNANTHPYYKRKLNILPILAAMNQSAKEARERFVSGHTGASIFEVEYLVHSGVLFHFLNVITFPLVNVLMRNKLSIWLAAALCNTNEFAW